MFQCRADTDRNRLYITLTGRILAEESEQAARQTVENMKALKPGFDVVTDISKFEPATQKELELLKQVQKTLIDHGVNRIVRIVGTELKATVGKIQFERTSRETKIVAKNFDSVEAAERFLDG